MSKFDPKLIAQIRNRAAKVGVPADATTRFLELAETGRWLLACRGNSKNSRYYGTVAFFIPAETDGFISLKRDGTIARSFQDMRQTITI